jgi:hypothetical protein
MIIGDYVNAVRNSPTWSGGKYLERLKQLGYDVSQLVPEFETNKKLEREVRNRLIEQGTPKKVLRAIGISPPNFPLKSEIKFNDNNLEFKLFNK